MKTVDDFTKIFGAPLPDSASATVVDRLAALESGNRLIEAIAPGIYGSGFFSVASLRENGGALGAWSDWCPAGAFLFATSVFGMLYIAVGEEMWLANTPYGSILPTDFRLDESVGRVARRSTRDELLQRPLFEQWRRAGGRLKPDELLALATPVSEGGAWDIRNLVAVPISDYLARTAAMFEPAGKIPISIMRR